MTFDIFYNYTHFQDNKFLDFMQHIVIIISTPVIIMTTCYYYATQNIQLKLIKLLNVVNELLEHRGIDTSKLYPGSWIKPLCLVMKAMYFIQLSLFMYFHLQHNEKHVTLQYSTGALACYRGSLGLHQLYMIGQRYFLLNHLLEEALSEKNAELCHLCPRLNSSDKYKVLCDSHTLQ